MKKLLTSILTLALAVSALAGGYSYINSNLLPSTVSVYEGEDFTYGKGLLTVEAEKEEYTQASARQGESYTGTLCLFGMLPIKAVRVNVVEKTYLIPGGMTFGVKMFTDGVLVVGFGDIKTASGSVCPAESAGMQLGDIIITIDGKRISGNADLSSVVAASEGKRLEVLYERAGERKTAFITPANASDRSGFKIGMWVRDSSAGIGTITYINAETGTVAGLGHGITDKDTETVLPVLKGEFVTVTVTGVVKGQVGKPGELKGVFGNGRPFARMIYNCEAGVYGTLNEAASSEEAIPVALKQEVSTGAAMILCTVDGEQPQYYDAEIESVNLSDDAPTQNIVVRITDERLIVKTGGIVQGMSGSPIVQNGKIVGAVTHVFVGNPTKGYGIFIENMLSREADFARTEKNMEAA